MWIEGHAHTQVNTHHLQGCVRCTVTLQCSDWRAFLVSRETPPTSSLVFQYECATPGPERADRREGRRVEERRGRGGDGRGGEIRGLEEGRGREGRGDEGIGGGEGTGGEGR